MNRYDRNYYNAIHVEHGWAVSAQFKGWLEGEDLSEMNPNALRYIAETLRTFDDLEAQEYANDIDRFLVTSIAEA